MKKSFFYGYIIILILFLLQGIMYGPRGSFGVFIKPITAEFDWPRALIAGAFSLSAFFQGFSGIAMGWLNDRLGPRFVITVCGILVGSGLMLMSLVDSPWQLYLFYAVPIGLGMGGLYAPQMSTAARWFVKRRNLMTGLIMAGGGLGGLIGPLLITWLVYAYSWQQAFLYIGIGELFLVVLFAQFLKRDPSAVGQTPYGEVTQTRGQPSSGISKLSLPQALHTRKFWTLAIVVFCVGFCNMTTTIHIVPYAIDLGIAPATAAIILSSMNVAMPTGSLVVGFIADRIGSRKAFFTCTCLLSSIILLLIPVSSPWLLGLFVTVLALGAGGVAVLFPGLVAELFGMQSHGAIVGCCVFAFTFGGAAGTFLAGSLFDATGNYRWVFSLCAVLVAVAITMAVSLNRIRRTEAAA